MQIYGIQDSIFKELLNFKQNQNASLDTITCILMTTLIPGQQDRREDTKYQHMLVLVKGDISISHHFFNLGEQVSWQISRIKCWNQALESIVDEAHILTGQVSDSAEANLTTPLPPLAAFSFYSKNPETSGPIDVTEDGNIGNIRSGSLGLFLKERCGSLTASFQLWHEGSLVNDISCPFDECQVQCSYC